MWFSEVHFGFDNKLHRVTGYVKCDQLTSRFADKSALIEDDVYFKFNQSMKDFIIAQVLPSLTEYEDVLITRRRVENLQRGRQGDGSSGVGNASS